MNDKPVIDAPVFSQSRQYVCGGCELPYTTIFNGPDSAVCPRCNHGRTINQPDPSREPEWIDVKSELPPTESAIGWVKGYGPLRVILEHYLDGKHAWRAFLPEMDVTYYFLDGDVTHWMPLPSPPYVPLEKEIKG